MPTPINIEQIVRDNPHLDMEKIKAACAARKARAIEGRGYNLAPPTERRRVIVGRLPGTDPRTIRLRASLHPSNVTISSNSQT
jgi:hypothetical protein